MPDTGGTKTETTFLACGRGGLSLDTLPSMDPDDSDHDLGNFQDEEEEEAKESVAYLNDDVRRASFDMNQDVDWRRFTTGGSMNDEMKKALNEESDWRRFTTAGSCDMFDTAGYSEASLLKPLPECDFSAASDPMAGSYGVYPPMLFPMPPCVVPQPFTTKETGAGKSRGKADRKSDGDGGWKDTVTTIMIKNLHNKVNQAELMTDLQNSGFGNSYDFLYLPIDTDTNANRGYAFINFVNPAIAKKFKHHYEDSQIGEKKSSKSGKYLKLSPATLQGFAANYAHYSNSRVQRGPPETRPIFFRSPDEQDADQANSGIKGKSRRNRSLIDVAAAEQKKSSAESQQRGGEKRFCHKCGGKVTSEFKFCIFCGATVIGRDH